MESSESGKNNILLSYNKSSQDPSGGFGFGTDSIPDKDSPETFIIVQKNMDSE